MIHFTYELCNYFMHHKDVIPSAVVIACANMLIQNTFNLMFGSKGLPKLRGYRGE